MRAAVVAAGNCAEPLLPSGVPDLQLDGLSFELDSANFLRSERLRCRVLRVF